MKGPVIIERKLGKERAAGLAHIENPKSKKYGHIEIDPRLEVHGGKNKDYFDTMIHEALHVIDPSMHEDDVADMAHKLTNILWKAGYRKVNL